jgi:hypothetical protein
MGKLLIAFCVGAALASAFWLSRDSAQAGRDAIEAEPVATIATPQQSPTNSLFTPVAAQRVATSSEQPKIAATTANDALSDAPGATQSSSGNNDAPGKADDAAPDHPKTNPFLNDAYSRAIAEDRAHPRSPSQWDEDFTEEPRDQSWAASSEHRLSGFFADAARRGVTLMGVQCHQTLCEMKLTEPMGVQPQFHGVVDDWYHSNAAFGNIQWSSTAGDNGQRYIVAIVRKWQKP